MPEPRLHIIHLSAALIWRGAEQQMIYLYEGLKARGAAQCFFCRAGGLLAAYCAAHNIPHVTYRRESGLNLGLAKALREYCRDKRPDFAHIHDPHAHNGWLLAVTLGLNLPAIVHRRVDFPVKGNVLNRWKYNHPQVKAVVAVSDRVKQILSPVIKDKDRLSVLHDAVDIAKFRVLSNRHLLDKEFLVCKGKRKVACIAALVDHKDIPTYIRMVHYVVEVLNRKDFHFFIIGGGALEQDIREMIAAYRLGNFVTMTGRREDIPAVLQNLDYFVFTSKMEGFGSTILEVMAAGLPVIATEAGAAAEVLVHRKNAMLANIGDEVALGNALLDLANDEQLSNSITRQAGTDVAAFSLESYAKRMIRLYQKNMSRQG